MNDDIADDTGNQRKRLYRSCAPVPSVRENTKFTTVAGLAISPNYDKFCCVCYTEATCDNAIVVCIGCDAPFHIYCHNPSIPRMYITEPHLLWICTSCTAQENSIPNSILSRKQRQLVSETILFADKDSASLSESKEWSSPIVRNQYIIPKMSKTPPSSLMRRFEAASGFILADESDPNAFVPTWVDEKWAAVAKKDTNTIYSCIAPALQEDNAMPKNSACLVCQTFLGDKAGVISSTTTENNEMDMVLGHCCGKCEENVRALQSRLTEWDRVSLERILTSIYVLNSNLGQAFSIILKDPRNLTLKWGVLKQLMRSRSKEKSVLLVN